MTGRPTEIDEHDPLAYNTLKVLKGFVDEIGHRGCTAHFAKVVAGQYRLKGKYLVQTPERFIEDHLVFPLLDGPLGHEIRPQPKQYAPRWPRDGGIPDFCLTTIPIDTARAADVRVFGEVKPPKHIGKARRDMADYLNKDLELDAITILTDGFDWELWVRPHGQSVDLDDDAPSAAVSLRDPLRAIQARNMEVDSDSSYDVRNRIDTEALVSFSAEAVREVVAIEFDKSL